MDDIRKGRCPLCAHDEIIEGPVLDLSPASPRRVLMEMQPLPILEQRVFPAGFTYSAGSTPGAVAVHGTLLRYACRACGFTQTFASTPEEIPIGGEYGTRLISSAPSERRGPYR